MTGTDAFTDVLSANHAFAEQFSDAGLAARAGRGLAVVTCMDSRIDPLAVLGLRNGDALVLRNPGGRVSADVLNSLVLGAYLLGVDRVLVLVHTDCKMAARTESDVHAAISDAGGPDTRSISFGPAPDQDAALRADVQRVRSHPLLGGVTTGGFVYDVGTGRVQPVC